MNDLSEFKAGSAGGETATVSKTVGRFIESFALNGVPENVQAQAKLNFLDAVGIGFASAGSDFGDITAAALRDIGGEGDFPVIGMGLKLSQRDSAHLNGTLIHGLDFDDTHARGVIHTSASAVPTVIAAALATKASGSRALASFIIASEFASRIAAGAAGGFHTKGFHPTAVVGAFGSALGAGHLYGLTAGQLADAQGIVLSKAAGSLQFLDDGAWTKRNHPGWASVCGLTAAAMAKHDFFGPKLPYEGRYGVYALHMIEDREGNVDDVTQGLGKVWELMNIAFKPYPACHYTHAFADAILELKRREGLKQSDIKKVTAKIHKNQVAVVCEPEANKHAPQNAYDGQFSVPYVVAASFVRDRFTLAELEDDAIRDPQILDLARHVTYEVDPDSPYPKYFSGTLVVETHDGRTLVQEERVNRGSADRPLSADEINQKFMDNATRRVPAAQAEKVREMILNLETQTDLRALGEAVRA